MYNLIIGCLRSLYHHVLLNKIFFKIVSLKKVAMRFFVLCELS